MALTTHTSKAKTSNAHASKPLKKQNRVKGVGGGAAANKDWNKMYKRLVAYKSEHNGETKVPVRYKEDPHLEMSIIHL